MTLRDAPGTFPGVPSGFGFAQGHTFTNWDLFGIINYPDQVSGWTIGASSVFQVDSLPPLDYHASVVAYEVRANLGLHTNVLELCNGKFGKIITALQFGPNQSKNLNQQAVPIPQDSALRATLWDPEVNDLPPDDSTTPVSLLPVNVVNILPEPAPIIQQAITIGVWLTPSLLTMKAGGATCKALALYDVTFKLIVDDGK